MRVVFEDKNLLMECIKIGWNNERKVVYFSNGIPTDTEEIRGSDIVSGDVVIYKKGINTIPVKFKSVNEFFIAMENEIRDNGYVCIWRK
jgi:hypothetical protein